MTSLSTGDRSTSRFLQIALVAIVLLVALFLRTHDLDRVPVGLDGDEMFNGWDARRVWKGDLALYFPANYGREPVLIYLIALATRIWGEGAWAMRMASVACGMVGLLFTWLLARRLFNRRVALLATALTAVSLWPVLLNRVALRAGLLPACQAIAVYALWRALEERSNRWALVAGLCTGLIFYTYTAGRIFPAVLLLWLAVALLQDRGRRLLRGNGTRIALAGLVAALVVFPLALFALRHPDIFNQRVEALSGGLGALRVGDPGPIWQAARATLGMFTRRGDWNWRYNPSGRPVFDVVTGALFYLGLIVCLVRLGRPEYALLVIWLAGMLLPSVLSDGAPSFWRAVGALTPIYLMPAIGADWLWEQGARWGRRVGGSGRIVRLGVPALVVAGLVAVGADTWHDYFEEWARQPEVLNTYGADIVAAAHYLDTVTPTDTPVWVSNGYASDLSRTMLDLQTRYPGPVRWFNGNKVTVWPSGWAGRDVLLVFTKSAPPNPDALAALGQYQVHRESDAAGRSHLWVYRIPGEALSEIPWQPAYALSGRFARDREVLGYDAPAEARRGTEVPVVVYWRVPSGVEVDMQDLPHSFVCLQDQAAGRCLKEESHYLVYPLWDWTEGDVVAQRYMVPVPSYLVPQTTTFRVGMYTSQGEISFAAEDQAGAPLAVGPVEVIGSAREDPEWDEETPTFGQELALLDHNAPAELSPGAMLEASLEWQAMRNPARDYAVRLELRDRDSGDVAAMIEETLGSDRHPTSRWVEGEPVHTFHTVQVPPDVEAGEFDIVLLVSAIGSGDEVGDPLSLGIVSVSGRPHYFDLPVPEHPLGADFGASIRLLGFDLPQVDARPGGQIELVLYWQALDTVAEDYKVFVHLYHPTIPGGLPGQHDGPPGSGAFPTSSWLPGEVVTDPHVVPIEPGADSGVSKMGVGLYRPDTGQRLPVSVDGQPQPDDVLIITQFEVE